MGNFPYDRARARFDVLKIPLQALRPPAERSTADLPRPAQTPALPVPTAGRSPAAGGAPLQMHGVADQLWIRQQRATQLCAAAQKHITKAARLLWKSSLLLGKSREYVRAYYCQR